MAYPTIKFNSTGSNTAASGAGPATALSGTAAATAANTTVTLSVDAPDLSGVATDGSAAIWVGSSSGRQWSKITAVDNTAKTVTVESAFANTESGKNWGIGGKRSTLAGSTQLGSDILAGWDIDIQTDQTLTAVYVLKVPVNSVTTQLRTRIYCSSTTRAVITTSTNSINLFNVGSSDCLQFYHLKFTNTAGTKGTYAGSTGFAISPVTGAMSGLELIDCIFDGFVCAVCADNVNTFGTNRMTMKQCEVLNCTDEAIRFQANQQGASWLRIADCYFHGNTGSAIRVQNSASNIVVTFSIFSANGRGIYYSTASAGNNLQFHVSNCVFKGQTNAGIEHAGSGFVMVINDSVFVSNGDYGIKCAAAQATYNSGVNPPLIIGNAWYSNTNGDVANGPTTFNDITLTGDPFVSSTDFGLNSTAGAGAALKKTGETIPNASANSAPDVGAVPSGGGGTTGGLLRNPALSGVV